MTGSDPAGTASDPARPSRLGFLGGTFDPIHLGHLTLARWARDCLALDRVILIPSGHSWQKSDSGAPREQRLEMVRLAVQRDPTLGVDDIEIRRRGPSFTIDTVIELRRRHGPEPALVWLLGSDQFHNLPTWHRYQELTDHVHLAVTRRERIELSNFSPAVEALLAAHGQPTLPDRPSGAIVFFRMPPVPVSATALRRALAAGEHPRELVDPGVLDYIERNGLYRPAPDRSETGSSPPS